MTGSPYTVSDLADFLRQVAPPELAEDWDNVGLLVGSPTAAVRSVLTCLTLTLDVAREAVQSGVDLVVSHHPVLFRPVQRLTTETVEGRLLLELIAAGVAVYSPHTGYDSSRDGINQQLAELFELQDVQPLRPLAHAGSGPDTATDASDPEQPAGAGRFGKLPQPLTTRELVERVKARLHVEHLQYVGEPERRVEWLAVACGSAAEFLPDAVAHGCQAFLTGEARFHACLEARSLGLSLILPGHYATERPAMERLAKRLAERFPELTVWPSRVEGDPLQWA